MLIRGINIPYEVKGTMRDLEDAQTHSKYPQLKTFTKKALDARTKHYIEFVASKVEHDETYGEGVEDPIALEVKHIELDPEEALNRRWSRIY